MRHRPGVGLVVALGGLLVLLLSFLALPWVSGGASDDLSFSDLRDVADAAADIDPGDVTGGDLPSGTLPGGDIGGEDLGDGDLGPPVTPPDFDDVGAAAELATDEFRVEYLDWYTGWIWLVMLALLAFAVIMSTLFVPRSKAVRMLLGFCTLGIIGVAIAAVDEDGRVAPRVSGAITSLVALAAHGLAWWALFGDDPAPDPAIGVWAAFAGILAVMIGCVLGTRTERAPSPPRPQPQAGFYGPPAYR